MSNCKGSISLNCCAASLSYNSASNSCPLIIICIVVISLVSLVSVDKEVSVCSVRLSDTLFSEIGVSLFGALPQAEIPSASANIRKAVVNFRIVLPPGQIFLTISRTSFCFAADFDWFPTAFTIPKSFAPICPITASL